MSTIEIIYDPFSCNMHDTPNFEGLGDLDVIVTFEVQAPVFQNQLALALPDTTRALALGDTARGPSELLEQESLDGGHRTAFQDQPSSKVISTFKPPVFSNRSCLDTFDDPIAGQLTNKVFGYLESPILDNSGDPFNTTFDTPQNFRTVEDSSGPNTTNIFVDNNLNLDSIRHVNLPKQSEDLNSLEASNFAVSGIQPKAVNLTSCPGGDGKKTNFVSPLGRARGTDSFDSITETNYKYPTNKNKAPFQFRHKLPEGFNPNAIIFTVSEDPTLSNLLDPTVNGQSSIQESQSGQALPNLMAGASQTQPAPTQAGAVFIPEAAASPINQPATHAGAVFIPGAAASPINQPATQGQNVYPQGQNVYPQGQNVYLQGQNVYPQGQNVYPQGQNVYLQGQNAHYFTAPPPQLAPAFYSSPYTQAAPPPQLAPAFYSSPYTQAAPPPQTQILPSYYGPGATSSSYQPASPWSTALNTPVVYSSNPFSGASMSIEQFISYFQHPANAQELKNLERAASNGDSQAKRLLDQLRSLQVSSATPGNMQAGVVDPQEQNMVAAQPPAVSPMGTGSTSGTITNTNVNNTYVTQSSEQIQKLEKKKAQLAIEHKRNGDKRIKKTKKLEDELREIGPDDTFFGAETPFDWWNNVLIVGGLVLFSSLFFINRPGRAKLRKNEKQAREQGEVDGFNLVKSTVDQAMETAEEKKSSWTTPFLKKKEPLPSLLTKKASSKEELTNKQLTERPEMARAYNEGLYEGKRDAERTCLISGRCSNVPSSSTNLRVLENEREASPRSCIPSLSRRVEGSVLPGFLSLNVVLKFAQGLFRQLTNKKKKAKREKLLKALIECRQNNREKRASEIDEMNNL